MAKEKEAKKEEKKAQESKPKAVVARSRKKRWYGLVAPPLFNSRRIGETLAGEPSELVGRTVKINLMNLVDDYKKQGINIKFKVKTANDDNGECETIGYEIIKSHARRMVRKGADKMDDSFIANTKDGRAFTVKPIIVTRNRVSHPTLGKMRKIAREYISAKIKELSTDEVFESVIQAKIQKELRSSLAKLCPIGSCEIRTLELIEQ